MGILATLWSLLAIPIGMFCLFLAWRIPFQDIQKNNDNNEEEDRINLTDEQLMQHFSGDQKKPIEQKRSIQFIVLFSGLGIGAILVGLEIAHPYFVYAGKFVFLLTIIFSFIIPLYLEKKNGNNLLDDNENSDLDRKE